jgi:hypothetical protein
VSEPSQSDARLTVSLDVDDRVWLEERLVEIRELLAYLRER